ncbi:MAG: ABC transporter ATP-binding protein [Planctomycetes bacterium]|nr:ABC transporter ATP-binding protein [Planctomycetota bacterium]
MKPAIRLEGLGKRYRIGAPTRGHQTLRESLVGLATAPLRRWRGDARPRPQDLWALRDVSLEVQQGEVVGLIGRNGAGKSTLLKLLSRITRPSIGLAEIRGRVGSLLEVGTGFHSELTGRENVMLSAVILGLTRREVRDRFDRIVEFSGIDPAFLDTPVKRYSSGMQMRLAFAVAAHLDPEILLIDEVLAVGDAEFQRKCLTSMAEIGSRGRTVVFVSHSMAAVESLCSRCVLLDHGRVLSDGPPSRVIPEYLTRGREAVAATHDLAGHPGRSAGSREVLTSVSVAPAGNPERTFRMGGDLEVAVTFAAPAPIQPVLGVVVKTIMGAPVFGVNNRFIPGFTFRAVERGRLLARIPAPPLMAGVYSLDLFLGDRDHDIDIVRDAISFDIAPADVFGSGKVPPQAAGPVYWRAEFTLQTAGVVQDDARVAP